MFEITNHRWALLIFYNLIFLWFILDSFSYCLSSIFFSCTVYNLLFIFYNAFSILDIMVFISRNFMYSYIFCVFAFIFWFLRSDLFRYNSHIIKHTNLQYTINEPWQTCSYIFPIMTSGSSFIWLCVPSTYSHDYTFVFNCSITFWHCKMCQPYFAYFLP